MLHAQGTGKEHGKARCDGELKDRENRQRNPEDIGIVATLDRVFGKSAEQNREERSDEPVLLDFVKPRVIQNVNAHRDHQNRDNQCGGIVERHGPMNPFGSFE